MTPLSERGAHSRANDTWVTWDIETREWTRLLCVCFVADDGTRCVCFSIRDVVRRWSALGLLRADVTFWAHFGGIFDHRFVLEELLPEWELVGGVSGAGNGIWSADLRNRESGEWLRLRDSARLLLESLENVTNAFGCPKYTGLDRSKLGDEWDAGNYHEVIDYCYLDCDGLMVSLQSFRATWRSLGIEPRTTIAATACAYVRSTTIPSDAWGWDYKHDRSIESCYHGGRTEVLSRAESLNGNCFDIISSYPAAMLRPLPTRVKRDGLYRYTPGDGVQRIVECTVEVPECPYPVLPYRVNAGALKGFLVFPTGRWTAMHVSSELEYAVSLGLAKIVSTARVVEYESEPFMADFIRYWANVKAKHAPFLADGTKNPDANEALYYIAKIAMNSSYGKFSEHPERETITSNELKFILADERDRARDCADGETRTHARDFGSIKVKDKPEIESRDLKEVRTKTGVVHLYGIQELRAGAFRHVAAGAFVTAYGRVGWHKGLCEMARTGVPAYGDTDSLFGTGTIATGNQLGDFTREYGYDRAEFLRSKIYKIDGTRGHSKKPDGSQIVKAKGLFTPMDYMRRLAFWAKLKLQLPIEREVSINFMEAVGRGSIVFERTIQTRQGRAVWDKRCWNADGSSRPWDVQEVEKLSNGARKTNRGDTAEFGV